MCLNASGSTSGTRIVPLDVVSDIGPQNMAKKTGLRDTSMYLCAAMSSTVSCQTQGGSTHSLVINMYLFLFYLYTYYVIIFVGYLNIQVRLCH